MAERGVSHRCSSGQTEASPEHARAGHDLSQTFHRTPRPPRPAGAVGRSGGLPAANQEQGRLGFCIPFQLHA